MTENTAHETLPTQEGETPTPDAPTAKKTPARRKVSTRTKATATEPVDAPAAPVVPAVEAEEAVVGAAVKTPKARKPRKGSKAAAVTADEPAPAQPELPSPGAVGSSTEREAQVETRAIEPETYRELERKTEQAFGRDGSHPEKARFVEPAAPPAPAAPPPQQEEAGPVSGSAPAPVAAESGVIGAPATEPNGAGGDQSFAPSQGQGQNQGRYEQRPGRDGRQGFDRNDRFNRQDRQDRQGGQFDRQGQGQGQGQRHDNRFDRRGQPNGGQGGDRPQGQFNQDRYNQSGGGGGQFNQRRHDRQDRPDRPERNDRPDRDGQGQPGGGGASYDQGGGGGDLAVSRPTEVQYGEGIVEVSGKGFGFLREAKRSFVQTPADIFVTPEVCRKYNLRDGQWIKGEVRRSSRGPQLFRLMQLNGEDVDGSNPRLLPNFDELTTINPRKRIRLETTAERYTTRVMDLMTPIGKGQRGLIVAPPRTGKTTLLQHIAEAVVLNHPEMKLIILLVDERPEEVTEIRRSVPQAEIMASSNDSDLKSHVRIAQLAMERCKRLVEAGQHVFMLLDSITRMARAFNNTMGGNRGTQSGGLAVGALEIPRKIFAAARNTEEAGSLTIMATALIETNSKMDDAIFQEFKGTGNMELVLDRKISDQRIYPAVDIFLSGTRREELLLQAWELDKINVIRRGLAGHKPLEAIERLLSFLKKFPSNAQMLTSLPG